MKNAFLFNGLKIMSIFALLGLVRAGPYLRCQFDGSSPPAPMCHVYHGDSWDPIIITSIVEKQAKAKLNFNTKDPKGYDKGFLLVEFNKDGRLMLSGQLFPSDTSSITSGFLQYDLGATGDKCSYCQTTDKNCLLRSDEVFSDSMGPRNSKVGKYLIILCNIDPKTQIVDASNANFAEDTVAYGNQRFKRETLEFEYLVKESNPENKAKVQSFVGDDDIYLPVISKGGKDYLVKGPKSNLVFDAAICTNGVLSSYLPMNKLKDYYVDSFTKLYYKPGASEGDGQQLNVLKHYNAVGCYYEKKNGVQVALEFVPADDKNFDGFFGVDKKTLKTYNQLTADVKAPFEVQRRAIVV